MVSYFIVRPSLEVCLSPWWSFSYGERRVTECIRCCESERVVTVVVPPQAQLGHTSASHGQHSVTATSSASRGALEWKPREGLLRIFKLGTILEEYPDIPCTSLAWTLKIVSDICRHIEADLSQRQRGQHPPPAPQTGRLASRGAMATPDINQTLIINNMLTHHVYGDSLFFYVYIQLSTICILIILLTMTLTKIFNYISN